MFIQIVTATAIGAFGAHATIGSYGPGCDRWYGFRGDNERCLPVRGGADAYLDVSVTGWSCSRGFREVDDGCVAIAVPENGYLAGGAYGRRRKWERGRVKSGMGV